MAMLTSINIHAEPGGKVEATACNSSTSCEGPRTYLKIRVSGPGREKTEVVLFSLTSEACAAVFVAAKQALAMSLEEEG